MTFLLRKKSEYFILLLGLSTFFLSTCKSSTSEKNEVEINEAITAFLSERISLEKIDHYTTITIFYITRCQSCLERYQAEIEASDTSTSAFVLQTYEPLSTAVQFQEPLNQSNVFLHDLRKEIPPGLAPDPDNPVRKITRNHRGRFIQIPL